MLKSLPSLRQLPINARKTNLPQILYCSGQSCDLILRQLLFIYLSFYGPKASVVYPFLCGFQDTSGHFVTPRDTKNRRLYLAFAIFLGILKALRSRVKRVLYH